MASGVASTSSTATTEALEVEGKADADGDAIYSFFFSSRRRHTRSDRDWSSEVCSSDRGQSGPRYLGWTAVGLHATAVLNGERRCAGLGADRSVGHARRRPRDGAIGHSTATRTLRWIRVHQIASFTDATQFFGEDVDLRRTLRTVRLFDGSDTDKRIAVDMSEIGRSRLV